MPSGSVFILDSGGIDTTSQDEVFAKLEEEIHDLSKKIR
jgi:hypothetical protein